MNKNYQVRYLNYVVSNNNTLQYNFKYLSGLTTVYYHGLRAESC